MTLTALLVAVFGLAVMWLGLRLGYSNDQAARDARRLAWLADRQAQHQAKQAQRLEAEEPWKPSRALWREISE